MSDRDELAAAVTFHLDDQAYEYATDHPDTTRRMGLDIAAVAIAVGYRKPRTVSTIEELEALPTDSTVRSSEGGIWFKEASGKGCSWTEPGAQWWHWATDITLPATVLYEPEPAA